MRLEVLLLLGCALVLCSGAKQCSPIYVRWPRVKLNVAPAADGAFSLTACRSACTNEEDPLRSGIEQQCSGFNHKQGPNQYTHNCQLFPREKVQHVDGYIEADDRYSYYWKYCVNTTRNCGGDYAFTFLSDRYMAESEVSRLHFSSTLEECLAECLNEKAFLCRSVSFNRTDGGCHLSQQNQLSKPSLIKLNNNPNYRIDYYENNCYNISDSFKFDYKCEENGIRVSVKSKFPYSGALYGLYDFFSCRIEPKEDTDFGYLFPYPTISKNCSDSIRYKGNDMVLEVVLSTDGVEPLYFITPDDLTYQARCPIKQTQPSIDATPLSDTSVSNSTAEFAASAHALFSMLANSSALAESQTVVIQKATTKDIFPLPLMTTTTPKTNKNDEKKVDQKKKVVTTTSTTPNHTSSPSTTTSVPKISTSTSVVSPTSTVAVSSTSTTSKPSTTTTSAVSSTSTSSSPVPVSSTSTPATTVQTSSTSSPSANSSDSRFSTHLSFPTPNMIHVETSFNKPTTKDVFKLPDLSAIDAATTTVPVVSSTTTTKSTSTSTTTTTTTTTTSPTTTSTTTTPSTTTATTTTSTTTVPTTTTTETPATTKTTTIASTTTSTTPVPPTTSSAAPKASNSHDAKPPAPSGAPGSHAGSAKEPIFFDVFHNGQPVQAVVVGSRITLSFTPYLAIDPSYISITGCQVEPVGSIYEWEKEPLAIIKDGCPADHVGLVCPPQKTDYGWKVTVESFRYQTTAQVQYTCLVRICPFAPCPETKCQPVEGCEEREDILQSSLKSVFATLGGRARRASLSLEQIKAALEANPRLQQQIGLHSDAPAAASGNKMNAVSVAALQQQLLAIGGDHKVTKRLVVLNSEEDLRYYVQTGHSDYRSGYGRKK